MKKFQLFRYLKKWLPLILCFFVIMTIVSYEILGSRQKYTASAVIEYCNEEAKDGYAPDGSQIDVTEIASSANMAKVMANLGLSNEYYSLDAFCAGINIRPIIEEQAESIQEAVNEEGEEYTVQPTSYIVSCTLDSTGSTGLVRDIFNELLDVYFSDYSSKHINQAQVNNQTKNLMDTDYDYLEMIELINAQLADTTENLHYRCTRSPEFRSADTGYSFADLRDQFTLLRDVNVYRLYSLVLGNRITKDKEVLLNKYANRIANYNLDGEKAQEDTQEVLDIIRSYVDKMRQSGNTGIDATYILQDVYGEDWEERSAGGQHVDRTVQYDELLRSWIAYQNAWDYARIDAAYCQFIIQIYQNDTVSLEEASRLFEDSPKQEPSENVDSAVNANNAVNADNTLNADNAVNTNSAVDSDNANNAINTAHADTEAEKGESGAAGTDGVWPVVNASSPGGNVTGKQVEEEIRKVIDRMNELYAIVEKTNEEYNEYLGATNIRTLSSVSVNTEFNMKLYMMVIAAFFLVAGCCGAVILGRAGDILEYLFMTDHLTDCRNRLSCDNYIHSWEGRTLSANMCCINIQITNQRELNAACGREEADHVLREFGLLLRELFEGRKNALVAYNGSAQFLTFFEKAAGESIRQEMRRFVVTLEQRLSDTPVAYRAGAANAGEDSLFIIRNLISKAVRESRDYDIGKDTDTDIDIDTDTAIDVDKDMDKDIDIIDLDDDMGPDPDEGKDKDKDIGPELQDGQNEKQARKKTVRTGRKKKEELKNSKGGLREPPVVLKKQDTEEKNIPEKKNIPRDRSVQEEDDEWTVMERRIGRSVRRWEDDI